MWYIYNHVEFAGLMVLWRVAFWESVTVHRKISIVIELKWPCSLWNVKLGEVGSITFTKCYDRAVFIQNWRENDQLWTFNYQKTTVLIFPTFGNRMKTTLDGDRTNPLCSAGYPAGAMSIKHHVSPLSIKPYPCTGWCRPVMWMLVLKKTGILDIRSFLITINHSTHSSFSHLSHPCTRYPIPFLVNFIHHTLW